MMTVIFLAGILTVMIRLLLQFCDPRTWGLPCCGGGDGDKGGGSGGGPSGIPKGMKLRDLGEFYDRCMTVV